MLWPVYPERSLLRPLVDFDNREKSAFELLSSRKALVKEQ
jgi:hypothetical protein